MKLSEWWMLSARVPLDGSPATVSGWGGMEAIADTVIPAVEGTFLPAKPLHWYPVFLLMVVTRIT